MMMVPMCVMVTPFILTLVIALTNTARAAWIQDDDDALALALALVVPPYPPLVPSGWGTWRLNRSTIVHTSNSSGWTDTESAAKYGIISFDWNNAKAIWLTPNRSQCTCQETLVEQARRVKAANPETKVLLYRNCMYALQWLSSERAAMEDPAKAHWFLRDRSTGEIYNAPNEDGLQYVWNYTNPEVAKYFIEIVVMGKGGTASPYVDGIFLDDPGPSTAAHPMTEYITNIRKAAKATHMSTTELKALVNATYTMVVDLRQRLHARNQMVWLNGVDNANPFPLIDDQAPNSTCPRLAPWQCGWWNTPRPGRDCVAFFQERCSNISLGAIDLGVMRTQPNGSWPLTIAAFLLLRQESAWLATTWWQATSQSTPLLWSSDLDRDVGVPIDRHCYQDKHSTGVFRRRWTSGETVIDCNDLSIVLPGD